MLSRAVGKKCSKNIDSVAKGRMLCVSARPCGQSLDRLQEVSTAI